jgi:site-specific DNA-methyltransferase (adenine-specific)
MQADWQSDGIELHHADCLERMSIIADRSVDMILADLPYGTTACKWDTVIPFEPLWAHYKRIIKRNGAIVLTASQPFTSALVMSNPKMFRYRWAWNKQLPTGFLDAKRRPLRVIEDVLVFGDGSLTYNPSMRKGVMRRKGGEYRSKGSQCYRKLTLTASVNDDYYPTDLLEISNANQTAKVHPTQKPVALMEYMIRTYTNEGETVLDNTMGSGTTGIACVNTGRNFIGMEKNAEIYATAQTRIESAIRARSEMLIPA